MKLTKQGVRDLGGVVPPRRKIVYTCSHIWERETEYDCNSRAWPEPAIVTTYRCGLCQEIRR